MDKNTIEMAHKTNIERLLEEFGDDHEDEINRAYNTQRSFEESGAKIRDFIPIFTYRTVKELLLKDIIEGY